MPVRTKTTKTTWDFSGTMTWVHGKHTVKGGFQFFWLRYQCCALHPAKVKGISTFTATRRPETRPTSAPLGIHSLPRYWDSRAAFTLRRRTSTSISQLGAVY